MCTVTFIPSENSLYITSNRDEKTKRKSALTPKVYEYDTGKILFPRDAEAGGTWIAAHENGNVVVFLNGGFKAHVAQRPYRKSRGLILLDLIDHPTPFNGFLAINLNNIEPFTAVIRDNGHLFEARWDGKVKHQKELDPGQPMIWSSVTLYNEDIISKRNSWFQKWISANPDPGQNDIIHFHRFTGEGDNFNDLMMNRNDEMRTVSITSTEISGKHIGMQYIDLASDQIYSEQLSFDGSTVKW